MRDIKSKYAESSSMSSSDFNTLRVKNETNPRTFKVFWNWTKTSLQVLELTSQISQYLAGKSWRKLALSNMYDNFFSAGLISFVFGKLFELFMSMCRGKPLLNKHIGSMILYALIFLLVQRLSDLDKTI